jgi:hypothetical protein
MRAECDVPSGASQEERRGRKEGPPARSPALHGRASQGERCEVRVRVAFVA